MAIDAQDKELLAEVSKNVLAIGRMIGSVKPDIDDLQELSKSLMISASTLETVIRTMKLKNDM